MIVIKRFISVVCALVLSFSFTVIPSFAADNVRYVEVLPECQPTLDVNSETDYVVENAPALVVGETYIVVWNGVEFECVTQDMSALTEGSLTGAFFGNASVMGGDDNGLPFAGISFADSQSMLILPLDGSTSITLSIYQVVEASPFESSGVLNGVSDMVDASTDWVGSFVDGVTQSPLLLLFVLTAFVSLGISIIALIKKK